MLLFFDNNTWKNTKGESPWSLEWGQVGYIQEVVNHRLITGKHEVACVVECTRGGYLFTKNNKMEIACLTSVPGNADSSLTSVPVKGTLRGCHWCYHLVQFESDTSSTSVWHSKSSPMLNTYWPSCPRLNTTITGHVDATLSPLPAVMVRCWCSLSHLCI